jgi:exonuclease VII large subunit
MSTKESVDLHADAANRMIDFRMDTMATLVKEIKQDRKEDSAKLEQTLKDYNTKLEDNSTKLEQDRKEDSAKLEQDRKEDRAKLEQTLKDYNTKLEDNSTKLEQSLKEQLKLHGYRVVGLALTGCTTIVVAFDWLGAEVSSLLIYICFVIFVSVSTSTLCFFG